MKARLLHGDIRREGTLALHASELELPARANVGIIGINGAGKSTLMHGLAGSLRSCAGAQPRLEGVAADPVAYVPQTPAFPDWLRVEQVAALHGVELTSLERALPGLLLGELRGRRAGALSAGQRQALAVAIALGIAAPLTLLDEPFAAIDFRRRVALLSILRTRDDAGLTIISSQNGADLLETCSWLVVLKEGRYVFSGPCAELTGGAEPAAALARFEAGVLALLADGNGVRRRE